MFNGQDLSMASQPKRKAMFNGQKLSMASQPKRKAKSPVPPLLYKLINNLLTIIIILNNEPIGLLPIRI